MLPPVPNLTEAMEWQVMQLVSTPTCPVQATPVLGSVTARETLKVLAEKSDSRYGL